MDFWRRKRKSIWYSTELQTVCVSMCRPIATHYFALWPMQSQCVMKALFEPEKHETICMTVNWVQNGIKINYGIYFNFFFVFGLSSCSRPRQFDSIYCWVILFVQLRIRMWISSLSIACDIFSQNHFTPTYLSVGYFASIRLLCHAPHFGMTSDPLCLCLCMWVAEKLTEKWIEHLLVFYPFWPKTYFNDSYHIHWTSHAFQNPNNCIANDYL